MLCYVSDDGTTRAGITAATSADAFDAVGAPIDISDLGAQIMGDSYNYLRVSSGFINP